MKTLFLFIALASVITAGAQTQTSPAEEVATKIAKRMKDSLGLTAQQQQQLYGINMDLHNRKSEARRTAETPAAAAPAIQLVENTRDSLYRQVLTPASFALYLQKKRVLVSNN